MNTLIYLKKLNLLNNSSNKQTRNYPTAYLLIWKLLILIVSIAAPTYFKFITCQIQISFIWTVYWSVDNDKNENNYNRNRQSTSECCIRVIQCPVLFVKGWISQVTANWLLFSSCLLAQCAEGEIVTVAEVQNNFNKINNTF